MYERTSNDGHTVQWNPTDEHLATIAMELSNGVPSHVSLPDEANVPVESDTAREVRYEYRRLVLDKQIRESGDAEETERLKAEYESHTGDVWEA